MKEAEEMGKSPRPELAVEARCSVGDICDMFNPYSCVICLRSSEDMKSGKLD